MDPSGSSYPMASWYNEGDLGSKTVFVGRSRQVPEAEELRAGARDFTNVYVKNFGEDMDDRRLAERFRKYGPVLSVRVVTDDGGRSRGFGFVDFQRHEDAQKAVDDMNGRTINRRRVYVGRAQSRGERQMELQCPFEHVRLDRRTPYQGVTLYVRNLAYSLDDEDLRQVFSPFGTVAKATVVATEGGRSHGYGFVCFSCPEAATRAVTEMNGRMVASRALIVALAHGHHQNH